MDRVTLLHRFTHTGVAGVFCILMIATSEGGWPHRVPDFSDEATWTQNDIVLSEVVSANSVSVLGGSELRRATQITLKAIQRFTPGEPSFQVQEGSKITLGAFIFPAFREFNQPNPVVGDTIVIVSPQRRMSAIYLLQPGTRGIAPEIVQTLQAISRLRVSGASNMDLRNAAFEPDPLVALYAMKRLLVATSPPHDHTFVHKLRDIRDAEDTRADVALVASRLLSHLTGQPPLNRDEYIWIKRRLSDVAALESTCLNVLLRRIEEYSDERPETIVLLRTRACDPNVSDAMRLAYLSAMITDAMFQYQHPDAHSRTIIGSLVEVLGHDCRFVRVRMAIALGSVARRLSRATEPNDAQKALLAVIKSALHDRLRTETDRIARHEIELSMSVFDARDPSQGKEGK